MSIKNIPHPTSERGELLRGAIEHRATWMGLLIDEAKKAGLDYGFAHNAVRRCGVFHGLTKQTSREFVEKAGSKLKALHIQDNHGENDDHLLPFTVNGLDWKLLMQALEENGYDRLFNMELPGEFHAPLAVRRLKIRYAKQLTEYLFSDEFIHG